MPATYVPWDELSALATGRLDFLDRPVGNLGFRFLKDLLVTCDPKNRRVQFHNAA